MEKVVLCQCQDYNLELLKEKINQMIDQLGGIESFIDKDAKVFIKLNCVGPFDPSMGITTHPIFVQAVIQIVKERTKNIIVGDNPATKDLIYTLKKCGIYDILIDEEVQIFDGKKLTIITNPNPVYYSKFEVSEEMIDVDILINLPKLKTHSLTYMTVAQKNLFGFIYGLSKAGWHVRANNPLEFGEAINDLYGAIIETFKDKKTLHICDGILALEGEGPSTGGFPKQANVILASKDAISLDRVAVEVVGLNYEKLFMNKIASQRKYGEGDLNKIQILGTPLVKFADLSFIAPKNQFGHIGLKLLKHKIVRNFVLEHPVINKEVCIKCGECVRICPPKTMVMKTKEFPHLSAKDCIRCWCCAEVCPQNAIQKSKRPIIGRIAFKNRD